MPLYEYRCPQRHTFEVIHKMDDPGPDRCEICGESPVEKVLYPAAIHFKGSGFYSTDYGRGGRKRDNSDSSPPGKSEGGDSKPVKDAKPDKPAKKAAEAS